MRREVVDAACRGDFEKVAALVAAGFDVNEGDTYGFPVLIDLLVDPLHCEAVEILLRLGADPNICLGDPESSCPLLRAVKKEGASKCVESMLAHGGNPCLVSPEGHSVLSIALRTNRWEHAEILMAHGADMNERDVYGNSLMMNLCFFDNYDFVYRLLEKGADPSVSYVRSTGEVVSLASLVMQPIGLFQENQTTDSAREKIIAFLKEKKLLN